MKITTLLGSPRKAGNTATVLQAFERLLPLEHTVTRINLGDYALSGCLGCDACQETLDAPGCSQEDDIARVLDTILESDLVVYASPVYCWGFTAQMKALMDRHYALVKWDSPGCPSLYKGKRTMLLTTCGGGAEGNIDLIEEAFRREIEYMDGKILGLFYIDNCSSPDKLGDRAQTVARRMNNALA